MTRASLKKKKANRKQNRVGEASRWMLCNESEQGKDYSKRVRTCKINCRVRRRRSRRGLSLRIEIAVMVSTRPSERIEDTVENGNRGSRTGEKESVRKNKNDRDDARVGFVFTEESAMLFVSGKPFPEYADGRSGSS